jgi:hypothetical protein
MHKANYKLYQIEIIRRGSDELTVKATNRFDRVFYAHIKRDKDNYWVGGADFEIGNKRTIKGIVWEFSLGLLRECREYDQRWYDFHCMTRLEENGETRPLTWEETDRDNSYQGEDAPSFKGGVKFYTERYEN